MAVCTQVNGNRLATTYTYDAGQFTSIDYADISRFDYGVNAIGQRTSRTSTYSTESGETAAWPYDGLGQVTVEDSSKSVLGRSYLYDSIGNRKKSANSLTFSGSDNYTTNALNQYTAMNSHPVTINPTYDADGNMTYGPVQVPETGAIKGSTLTWDGENRLTTSTIDGVVTSYLYGGSSRLVGKISGTKKTAYVYDGWNMIADCFSIDGDAYDINRTYYWGLDLSGTLQGAGGVGGLLSGSDHSSPITAHYFPCYDGNGIVVAHYEYDGFGRCQVANEQVGFSHRFSTKSQGWETGLFYCGYRYNPLVGRWINRDPIREVGGFNLYSMLANNSVSRVDLLGLKDCNQNNVNDVDSKAGLSINAFDEGGSDSNTKVELSKGLMVDISNFSTISSVRNVATGTAAGGVMSAVAEEAKNFASGGTAVTGVANALGADLLPLSHDDVTRALVKQLADELRKINGHMHGDDDLRIGSFVRGVQVNL